MDLTYSLDLGDTNLNQAGAWNPQFNGTSYGAGTAGPVPIYTGPISMNNGSGDLTLLSVTPIADTPENTEFEVEYELTGSSVTVGISDGLSLSCQDSATCDRSDTSSIVFQLPTGVTLASASGVFPSVGGGGGTSAPEPASWAMLPIGVSGTGASVVTRRRTLPRLG